jgi:hypothetical protein
MRLIAGSLECARRALQPAERRRADPPISVLEPAAFDPIAALSTDRFATVAGGGFIMTAVSGPAVLGGWGAVGDSWSSDGTIAFAERHRA